MSWLADVTGSGVGTLMSGIGTLAKDIRSAITGDMSPEKQADIQEKIMAIELQAAQAQTAINMAEAQHESIFVAGWRPFVGWVGGVSLAYAGLIEPLMSWIAQVNGYTGGFPKLDTTITMQILFGILGLGAYRTYDKKQSPNMKGRE